MLLLLVDGATAKSNYIQLSLEYQYSDQWIAKNTTYLCVMRYGINSFFSDGINREAIYMLPNVHTFLVRILQHKPSLRIISKYLKLESWKSNKSLKDTFKQSRINAITEYVASCPFAWMDQKAMQGYNQNVALKRGIQLKCIQGKLCTSLVDKALIQRCCY